MTQAMNEPLLILSHTLTSTGTVVWLAKPSLKCRMAHTVRIVYGKVRPWNGSRDWYWYVALTGRHKL